MALRRNVRRLLALAGMCGVWLSAACQDGYPIAPTRCDEWCEQVRRQSCEATDPAACVVACEKAGVGREGCSDFVTQAVQCLRGKTDAELDCATWNYTELPPCSGEQAAALLCGSTGGQGSSLN